MRLPSACSCHREVFRDDTKLTLRPYAAEDANPAAQPNAEEPHERRPRRPQADHGDLAEAGGLHARHAGMQTRCCVGEIGNMFQLYQILPG